MKKILITGATGFVGKHLTEYLSSNSEVEIFGTSLDSESSNSKVQIKKIDLKNQPEVLGLINEIKPDQIYHLAAFTSPADSFDNPTAIVLGNIEIQMNILNSVRKLGLTNCRLLVVTSGEVYGMVESEDLPIKETLSFNPVNPYAVSKVAQDFLGLQYSLTYGLDIIRVRPFNHTGPGQSPSFVIPAFARQIALIEKNQQEPVLKVGNLETKRDFTDVRDIVRGYGLIMEKGVKGEVYNIGSGKSYATKELLDLLLSLTQGKIEVREDPSKTRPIEVHDVYCDFSKLNSLTGWKPEIPIEQILKDTLDYWRSVV